MKFSGASLLGGGTAAVILVPAVLSIAKTTAAKQVGLSGTGGTYGNLWEQLDRLMFHSFPYATSGDQAAINLYCGCAALLFTAARTIDFAAGFVFLQMKTIFSHDSP